MQFNPEDGQVTGPRCRNCHKGSSGCGACHNTDPKKDGVNTDTASAVADNNRGSISLMFAAMFQIAQPSNWPDAAVKSFAPYTDYKTMQTSNGLENGIASTITTYTVSTTVPPVEISNQVKSSRTVAWSNAWRTADIGAAECSDDGLSFPHRTLGWKMLKDDLFGIDVGIDENGAAAGLGDKSNSELVQAGAARQGTIGNGLIAHDVDSVCLDCHNPTVWNATSSLDHTDSAGNSADDMDDDLILRGLP